MQETSTESHAFIINYESELTTRFGSAESLASKLNVPVFYVRFSQVNYEEQRELRRQLPANAKTYITKFREGVPGDLIKRVLVTPGLEEFNPMLMAFRTTLQDPMRRVRRS